VLPREIGKKKKTFPPEAERGKGRKERGEEGETKGNASSRTHFSQTPFKPPRRRVRTVLTPREKGKKYSAHQDSRGKKKERKGGRGETSSAYAAHSEAIGGRQARIYGSVSRKKKRDDPIYSGLKGKNGRDGIKSAAMNGRDERV